MEKLGITIINEDSWRDPGKLEKVVKKALLIEPLGDICYIQETLSKESIKGGDIIAIVGSIIPVGSEESRILCSTPDHTVFAHELAHVLGLKHYSKECDFGGFNCKKNSKICPYATNLMGCMRSENPYFLDDAIVKLKEMYLK